MGNTATNVSTGKPNVTGAVYVGPKTATLPTDATTALPSSFVCLGYVSEDGVENANEMDVSDIKAWGGNIVSENITLKHYMNTTWVARPIPQDMPSNEELFGEFFHEGMDEE